MRDFFSEPPLELVAPDYSIYRYTDSIYKIINFKHPCCRCVPPVRSSDLKHESKLVQSLSRARRSVLELALCNDWKHFCTFTLDDSKYDRYDLDIFIKDFTQFIRDFRKQYSYPVEYLLVPEEHKDGAWHLHGLLSDISIFLVPFSDIRKNDLDIPFYLADMGYSDWLEYSCNFGFCSIADIRDSVACSFYISKYISKHIDDCRLPVNAHSYYASKGLNRACLHGDVYGYCSSLDRFLDHDYEFCRTGMTHVKDGLSWDFAFEYIDHCIEPLTLSTCADIEREVDLYVQYTQSAIDGFREASYE